MTGQTHILGGITASLAFAQLSPEEPVLILIGGVVGSLIPDICHGGSKIGKTFPLLSKIINSLFGHRTFTHSLLFLALAALLFHFVLPIDGLAHGLLAGMISHIILDMMTKHGVKLLFPWKVKVRFPFTVKTGGFGEYVAFAALSLFSVYFGYGIWFQ